MSFISLILKNPFRKRSSAILAIIGIGIGIATIVALGAVTDGMVSSLEDTIHAGGSDFTIVGKDTGSSAYGTSTIDEDWVEKIGNYSGVDSAYGIYVGMFSTKNKPMFTLIGIDPVGLSLSEAKITEGKLFKDDTKELIIGKLLAEDEDKGVGDYMTINGEEFKIVGLYESGDIQSDGGAMTSLKTVQEMAKDEGNVSNVYVKVEKGQDIETVKNNINKTYGDDISVVGSIMEMENMKAMLDMLNGASWAISLLAIVVGGLGIINTMLMSVFERTREIGVLKAVGWSDRRVLGMIVGESIVITLVAGIIGTILGVFVVQVLLPMAGSALVPIYSISTFVKAFGIAIIVGIVGGIYPALKAVRLAPTEALRYEWIIKKSYWIN